MGDNRDNKDNDLGVLDGVINTHTSIQNFAKSLSGVNTLPSPVGPLWSGISMMLAEDKSRKAVGVVGSLAGLGLAKVGTFAATAAAFGLFGIAALGLTLGIAGALAGKRAGETIRDEVASFLVTKARACPLAITLPDISIDKLACRSPNSPRSSNSTSDLEKISG